jgi:preprotein translocase subunit SecY
MVLSSLVIEKKTLIYRVSLTLFMVALIRFVSLIPISGIDQNSLYPELKNSQILNFLSSFSQGNFFVLNVFALGILPSIHASIIIQLMTSVLPPLRRLQKEEGKVGRQKLLRIVRYLTATLAFCYGVLITFYLKPFVFGWTILNAIELAMTLTVGALILLWFSEIITEQGFGNGTSLIIFVNISSSLPTVWNNFNYLDSIGTKLLFLGICVIGIIAIITVQSSSINVDVVSVNTLILSKLSSRSYIPLRLTPSGILPLILTSVILNGIAAILSQFYSNLRENTIFNVFYLLMYFLLTLFFGYVYAKKSINPTEVSGNMKERGFTLAQVNPGSATIQFLQEVLNRISIFGGFLLSSVITLPILLVYLNPNLNRLLGLGTTALFILVGVVVDLARQLETYEIVDSYDGI